LRFGLSNHERSDSRSKIQTVGRRSQNLFDGGMPLRRGNDCLYRFCAAEYEELTTKEAKIIT
jgi:hypothetical protein